MNMVVGRGRFGSQVERLCIVVCISLFGCALSSPVAAGEPGQGEPAIRVRLYLKWFHQFQFAGYYAACKKGFYRAEGLDVKLFTKEKSVSDVKTASPVISKVLNGTHCFGICNEEGLVARINGKPIVMLAAVFQQSARVVVVRRDSGIRNPQDLAGRRLITGKAENGAQIIAMLKKEGVPLERVTLVAPLPMGGIDSLLARKVDAISTYVTDAPYMLRRHGVEPVVIAPMVYGVDFYGDVLFTSEKEVRNHPEVVAAFRRASLKGWRYAMGHVDEMVEYMLTLPDVRERGFTAELLRYEAEETRRLIKPELVEIGYMNPGRWEHMARTLVSVGLVKPGYSLKGFVYDPNPRHDHTWFYIMTAGIGVLLAVAGMGWLLNLQLHKVVVARTRDLALSENRYRTIFEGASEGILVSDAESGRLLYGNPAMLEMLGIQPGELNGLSISQIHAPFAEKETGRLRNVSCGTGKARNFYANISRARTRLGEQDCIVEFYSDVTEHYMAESERRMLIAVVEQATEMVMITDTQGVITYVNNAFEKISGYAAGEVTGRQLRDFHAGKYDVSFYREIMEQLRQGVIWRGHIVHNRKDGSRFTVDCALSSVRDPHGQIVNFVGIMRDLTREIKLEEQFRQAQKMEAIGQLTGGIAHDFNNMLQGILGYTDMVCNKLAAADPNRKKLERVLHAADTAAELVNKLLAFSRQQVLQLQDLDLNKVIPDLFDMLRHMLHRNIELKFIPGNRLGAVAVDRGILEQAIVNLCVNSRDAMPDGGVITIETENVLCDREYCDGHPELAPGRYVLLRVTDTGCGMDEETRKRIFEPFFTTKGVGKGTGLGLAMVYGAIRQHKGMIQVYSEPGKGTTFKIYLPMVERPATAVGDCIEGSVRGGDETILLVDDEEIIRESTREILEQAGYRVLTAADGVEALRLLDEHGAEVDLALLDVVMPRLCGHELQERVSAMFPNLPVIFASGYSRNAVHTDFILQQGLHLLQKPYKANQLLRKVREVLDKIHA